ncbi:thymidine kinase [Proteus columbae]|uniref:thymidine kinase n=1 Tax=Proteus columbae TaxID=1987580 RepID=UPI002889D622|nr:thymidine kinase [Proteus columbae]
MASLYFYYSAMNAGKTTALLQAAYNYEERKMRVLTLKPKIDDRESTSKIVSRIGLSRDTLLFEPSCNLYYLVNQIEPGDKPHVVLVDEAQFLTKEQVIELGRIVDDFDIPVLCYGLRTDFMSNLFEGSAALLGEADKLISLKTICHCGRAAHKVLRIDEDGNVVRHGESVEIGGNDRYVSVCRKHWRAGEIC